MKKPSWLERELERGKETWRVTWPVQTIYIIIVIVFCINVSIMLLTDRTSHEVLIINIINGFLVSGSIFLTGFNFHHYRDHYLHMAAKHNIPAYEQPVKYAKLQIAAGIILFIAYIALLITFPS